MSLKYVCALVLLLVSALFVADPPVTAGQEIEYAAGSTAGPEIEYSEGVMESRIMLLRSEGRPIPGPKDPFVAGLLSFFMLGVGQIYAKEYTKGSIFIAAGLLDKLALILLVSHINNRYAPSGNELVNLDWQSFDNSTRLLVVGYIVGSLGLRVFCVADAVSSARKFNQRYYSSYREGTAGLSFDEEQFKLYYNFSFSD
jgi:hypothetical protein